MTDREQTVADVIQLLVPVVYRGEADACDYCGDEPITEPHAHHVYAQREGASTRTADDLCLILARDTADIVPSYSVPVYSVTADPGAWSIELADDAEIALADAGFSVVWNDGYIIERIVTDNTKGEP